MPPLAVLGLDTSQAYAATEGMVILIAPLLSGSDLLLLTNAELPREDSNVETCDRDKDGKPFRAFPSKYG